MLTLILAAAAASWTTESPADITARLDAARLPFESCLTETIAARPGSEPAESSIRLAAAVCRDREETLRRAYENSPYGFTGGARDVERLISMARQRGEDIGLTRKRPPG